MAKRGRPRKVQTPGETPKPKRRPRAPSPIQRVTVDVTTADGAILTVDAWEVTFGTTIKQFGQRVEAEAWYQAERQARKPTELMKLCRRFEDQLNHLVEVVNLEPDRHDRIIGVNGDEAFNALLVMVADRAAGIVTLSQVE